jgi:Hypervirulence associated proteins TUDOR domain
MGKRIKVGDHVSWNSEAGHVSGRIIKVHSKDVDYKGTRITPARTSLNTKLKAIKRTISPCTKDRP